MNKHIIESIIILTVITLFSAQFASAVEVEISHYSYSNGTATRALKTAHPSSGALYSAIYETFTLASATYITRISIAVGKAGTPVGYLIAEIRATNNTYVAGTPTGTLYETSEQMDFADLDSSVDLNSFYFPGTNYYAAGNYSVAVYAYGSTIDDAANWIEIMYDGSSSTYAGYSGIYTSSAWTCTAASDFVLYIYGDTTPPDPLPTGGLNVDTSDADEVMEALIGYGVPVVVMLLPMIFIWLVGGRGKWPMLLGISIGTGIGYLFGLVPVWLVFMVSIGVVGFAYQSVRSGN